MTSFPEASLSHYAGRDGPTQIFQQGGELIVVDEADASVLDINHHLGELMGLFDLGFQDGRWFQKGGRKGPP